MTGVLGFAVLVTLAFALWGIVEFVQAPQSPRACHFCSERPVVRVRLSRGCIAFPALAPVEQHLCLHHAMRSTPLGTIDVLEVLPGVPDWDRAILVRRYSEVRSC